MIAASFLLHSKKTLAFHSAPKTDVVNLIQPPNPDTPKMATEQEVTNTPDRPVVRMIVLETDMPDPKTQSRHGTFGEILHEHFVRAGDAHDPPLGIETDTRYIVNEKTSDMPKYHDFDDYDALLITGSVYSANDNDPWILNLLMLLKGDNSLPRTYTTEHS